MQIPDIGHVYRMLPDYRIAEDNHPQFFVPRGFAHGFAVLSETDVFQYKCDNFYELQADGGISIKDESLGTDWEIPTENAILSEKDMKHNLLKDFDLHLCMERIFLRRLSKKISRH